MVGRLLTLLALLLIESLDGKDVLVVYFAASDATNGTVKVRVNGSPLTSSRSTICWDSSSWGMEEASVTCRQMGFLNAISTVGVSDTAIGPIIVNVRCSGDEPNLADCSYYYSLSGYCTSQKHVKVSCFRNPGFSGLFDVRLNGSAAHKGIVLARQPFQGKLKQQWYAQCYNLWSKNSSEVICRQLGYSGVKATTRVTGSLLANYVADGEIKCIGPEQTLRGCSVIGTSACTDKTTYPEVECNLDSETQQPFDIRLSNGNNSAGTVELLKYGRWGVICDVNGEWNLASARVVCQQLSFVEAIRVTEPAEFGQGNGSIHLRDPGCKGDEWSIEKCPIPYGWGGKTNVCQTKETAGVVCSPEKFPSHDISSNIYTQYATKSFGRFFLHSPGFPQLFNYEAHTHLRCTMTSTTIVEFSLYIHYKRFQETHTETLSFHAIDTQQTNSNLIYFLQLYGDDSKPGPYMTNTASLTMQFRSNGAKGSGKLRVEIRVPKSTDVSLTCSKPAIPTTTTTTTTLSPTSPTSQGSTKGGVKEQTTTPVTMTTDQTISTMTTPADVVDSGLLVGWLVGGLLGAITVAIIAIILGVVLQKLGLVRFGKRQSPQPASDTEGYDDTRVEFTAVRNGSAYASVGPEYVNDAFVPGGTVGHPVASDGVLRNEPDAPYDYVETNIIQRPGVSQHPTRQGNKTDASPYANVRDFGQDRSRENQSRLRGQVPESPYDDVRSVGPHNTAESCSDQARGVQGLTPSLSNNDAAQGAESPYAHLDPVDHREYVDFKELSQEQLRPI